MAGQRLADQADGAGVDGIGLSAHVTAGNRVRKPAALPKPAHQFAALAIDIAADVLADVLGSPGVELASKLGMVGLEPVSQKLFETRLAERLRAVAGAPFLVLEGESRKVGCRIVPQGVWRALCEGTNLELVAPDAARVEFLLADYLSSERARMELPAQLEQVEARMARPKDAEALVDMYARGAHEELVLELLERYYDPLYRHSEKGKLYAARIDTTDVARAARAVLAWIEGHPARSSSQA